MCSFSPWHLRSFISPIESLITPLTHFSNLCSLVLSRNREQSRRYVVRACQKQAKTCSQNSPANLQQNQVVLELLIQGIHCHAGLISTCVTAVGAITRRKSAHSLLAPNLPLCFRASTLLSPQQLFLCGLSTIMAASATAPDMDKMSVSPCDRHCVRHPRQHSPIPPESSVLPVPLKQ
jgi:hypothetical protein